MDPGYIFSGLIRFILEDFNLRYCCAKRNCQTTWSGLANHGHDQPLSIRPRIDF